MLPPRGAYAATPVFRFLQRFECRFCCLRVAAACTRALAHAHARALYCFFACRLALRLALLLCQFRRDETIYKLKLARRTPRPNQLSLVKQPATFSDVVATSVVAIDCPRVRFPAERSFFLLFFCLEGPYVKQTNFQGHWTQCQKRRTNAEQRQTLPKKYVHQYILPYTDRKY